MLIWFVNAAFFGYVIYFVDVNNSLFFFENRSTQQFAVNASYSVKLVSHNQNLIKYYSGRLHDDIPCNTDRDCVTYFANSLGE